MAVDWLDTLIGAGVVWVSWGLGALRARRRVPAKPGPPRCDCHHVLAMHDLRTGECHDLIEGDPILDARGSFVVGRRKRQCPCRQYVGPVPVDQVFVPPPPLPRTGDTRE